MISNLRTFFAFKRGGLINKYSRTVITADSFEEILIKKCTKKRTRGKDHVIKVAI